MVLKMSSNYSSHSTISGHPSRDSQLSSFNRMDISFEPLIWTRVMLPVYSKATLGFARYVKGWIP